MKKLLQFLCLIMSLCFLLTGCKNNNDTASGGGGASKGNYSVPKDLLTTEQYHEEIKKLLSTENFSTADDEFLKNLNTLGDRVHDMIYYSDNDITECSGTKYYVSNNGDDKNDGKSPETAWATLDKSNSAALNEGDMVLFERGGFWRGNINPKNGVTYSAYGKGAKPQIYASVSAADGEWTETDTENVWVYSKPLDTNDVPTVVFNYSKEDVSFADKKDKKSELKKDLTFVYMGSKADDRPIDRKIYLRCEKGNPGEVFDSIEFALNVHLVDFKQNMHDITINNISFFGGNDHGFNSGLKNITFSYCTLEWQGGSFFNENRDRSGGGGGAWHNCDKFVYDHCYFNQQFDCAVSPQYNGNEEEISVFKNFTVKDCMFENCDYTLEYFSTQKNTTENRIENMYFGYNFCRLGGAGFGVKPSQSAYIKSWGHENTCIDCRFEYNIFDRAAATTLEIISHEQTASGNNYTLEYIPKLNNNVYLQKKDKKFAIINGNTYKFNEEAYNEMKNIGIDKDSVFIYTNTK